MAPVISIEELQEQLESKFAEYEVQLQELRAKVDAGQISADKAHERIRMLEEELRELKLEIKSITKELEGISEAVQTFSPKLDKFMENLWKAFFLLLVIVAGLVGIKLF